jgi:hypothetical protein
MNTPALKTAAFVLVLGLVSLIGYAQEGKPAAASGDGAWVIELDRPLLDNGEGPLMVYINRQGGKWTQGFGNAQTWNRACHDVDFSGLNATADSLKGVINVTINPDQWIPVDLKPIKCVYTLDAAVAEAKIKGTFEGKFGDKAVKGKVTGKVIPKGATNIENCQVDLTLENAVRFTDENQRRLGVWFKRKEGKLEEGRAATDAGDEAKCDPSGLAFTNESLTGVLVVPFGAPGGKYEFTLNGTVVNNEIGGRFKAKGGNQSIEGLFVGTIGPLKAKK